MSNINYAVIDENFPVLGEDNPSQGFRDNFLAIKNALNVARTEIENLESSTAQGVTIIEDNLLYNDFQGNVIKDSIIDYSGQSYFSGQQNLSGSQVILNLQNGMAQKIGIIGNTTLKFTNWPQTTTQGRFQKLLLHVVFNIDYTDPNKFNYRLNFSTEVGGIIKGASPLEYEFNAITNKYIWFLRPSIIVDLSENLNEYEHVLEVWSYDGGLTVFVNYINKFIGV